MNEQLDENLADYEANGCGYWWYDCPDCEYAAGAPVNDSSQAPGPTTTTGTNNQVEGVDEADFVKNDGHFIYIVKNGALRIFEAWPATATHEVSVTSLEGTPQRLFVEGNRALVYLSVRTSANAFYRSSSCTYGYDCDFSGDGTSTMLVVFDISDRSRPRKVRQVTLSGSFLAGRKIGNAVHTVVSQDTNVFSVEVVPEDRICRDEYDPENTSGWQSGPPPQWAIDATREAYERLRETNRERILSATLSTSALPTIHDSATSTTSNPTAMCANLYETATYDGRNFTSLVSIDMGDETSPPTYATVMSRPGAVYASDSSLYMAVRSVPSKWFGWYGTQEDPNDSREVSTIHKFNIASQANNTYYLSSGIVDGHVLNQFAMDEFGGDLRVATTSGWVPDPNAKSQVSVLREFSGDEGRTLSTIGFVGDIGPGEDIRSVRFDGERAFIVTFKKTDPLFLLDLADPVHPTVLSELQIPGFSTYMHMLDSNHILSVGYDADDHGDFAFFNGMLVQVFDVSNPSAPTLQQRHVIGTRGSSSEALTNHLAFTYYPERHLLALPATICEGGGNGAYGDRLTFSGLMLLNIDIAQGISELGRVTHPEGMTSAGEISCGTWWTNAHSEVERSLFFDDYVYSISSKVMRVQDLRALGTDVSTLPLE